MTHLRPFSIAVVVAAVATFASVAAPAGAQSANEKPKAVEVGVSPTEIHIAVVADVDSPLAPNLFKGAVDGTKAGAAFLNSKAGGGGLASRKVVVDFYDSKLNPTEARNATIEACQNDLALVGTSAVFLSNVDDIVNCKDQAGAVTGIPDIATFNTGVAQSCNPMSFPVIGKQIDCATATQKPQTYYANQGYAKWLLSQNKGGLHGPFVVGSDTKDAQRGGTVLAKGVEHAGIEVDVVARSGRAPQSEYTNVIQQMKTDNANFAGNAAGVAGAQSLRSEAQLQGLDSTKIVWSCNSCYGNTAVTDNADLFEGEYQALGSLPNEEAKYNKTLAAYLANLKKVGGTPDQFAGYAFQSVIAFRDAVNKTVAQHGVNGITRANLVAGLQSLTDFDADGMAGARSFKSGEVTPCFVQMQFTKGKWVRRYPSKPGTFDCKKSNNFTFQADLLG